MSPAVATTEVEEDVDGGPLGVLSASPAATTTVAKENIDGGPARGAAGESWQWPPPSC
jgi:hypothetical protein